MNTFKYLVILAVGLISAGAMAQTSHQAGWIQADEQIVAASLNLPSVAPAGRPLQAGMLQTLNVDLAGSEVEAAISNNEVVSVWKFAAPGCGGLTVYYDSFNLDGGASVTVTNGSGTQVLGPYTHQNNPSGGCFATGVVNDDSLIIHYQRPMAAPASSVVVSAISILKPYETDGFGGAGACEVNINCPEGDNWQIQKKGVARLLIKSGSSSYWCTGSLINNTRQDRTPYLLTANHCGKEATTADLNQWIVSFNYETSGCANPAVEPEKTDLTGVEKIAQSIETTTVGSDFYLVKLKQTIPEATGAYFNGWSLSPDASPTGASIHHPQGDIKKVSTYTTPLANSNWNGTPMGTHWQVHWAATTTNHGVTEGGSSGSPLFNNEGLIVGHLTGGQSGCSTPTEADYYGKLSYSWKMSLNAANQLATWLDPDNTGAIKLGGIALGLKDRALNNLFTVSPNPASTYCEITTATDLASTTSQAVVMDITGRTLLTTKLSGETNHIDLSGIKPGVYCLVISNGNLRGSFKLLVQ